MLLCLCGTDRFHYGKCFFILCTLKLVCKIFCTVLCIPQLLLQLLDFLFMVIPCGKLYLIFARAKLELMLLLHVLFKFLHSSGNILVKFFVPYLRYDRRKFGIINRECLSAVRTFKFCHRYRIPFLIPYLPRNAFIGSICFARS